MPQIRSYHLHLPFYHADSSNNLKWLYINRILKDLVNKMSVFFLPIFLFEIGKSTNLLSMFTLSSVQKGMVTVGLFLAIAKLLSFCTALPIGKIIKKIGYSNAIMYSYFFRIISFAALFYSPTYPLLLIPAVVCEAIQSNLFWNSYHTVFCRNILKIHIGKDLSIQQFFLQITAIAIPALAGFSAEIFGLEVLFLFGLVGTLLGFISATQLHFNEELSSVSFQEFKEWLQEKTFRHLMVAHSARHIHDSVLFLWPLYIYLTLGSIEKVGFLYTLSLFLVLVTTVFAGIYIDSFKTKKPFYMSGFILGLLWILRIKFITFFSIAIIDATDKLFSNYHWLYFDSVHFKRGKGKKAFPYFVYCEMVSSLITGIFWLLFSLLFLFTQAWQVLFIIAATAVILSTHISERKLDTTYES